MNNIENTNGQQADQAQIVTSTSPNNLGPTAPSATQTDNIPTGSDGAPLFVQGQGESDRAFEAFLTYWELGAKRRYSTVGKEVGATLITVKRWARDFDWRGRLRTYNTHCARRVVETEATLEHEEQLDAARSRRAFRERQCELAESILLAAERYLERADDDDLDAMSFADACKALEIASRYGKTRAEETEEANTSLRDQLTELLEQAYGKHAAKKAAAASATPTGSAPPTDAEPRRLIY